MKRAGGLYELIAEPENLRLAFWKARKGKGGKVEVEEFRRELDRHVAEMRHDLLGECVPWGPYQRFQVYDPKERTICAAPFRDRVLHHAIIQICEPVFERYQIADSYACRTGRGLHACLERATFYTRTYPWFLKLDVRKYFDSISHPVLLRQLGRRFKDARLMGLFSGLLGSYQTAPGCGIPIGNLTSQYFANQYLAPMDHLIKEELRIPGYIRYMDDFVLWHPDRDQLNKTLGLLRDYCRDVLALDVKPPALNRTVHGISMLGYRVFPGRVLLTRRSRDRYARKLSRYWSCLQKGEWNQREFAEHVLPLTAYAGHADSVGFRRVVMEKIGCSPQVRTA
jgi:RNA-directed DNA polymerase